VFADIKPQTFNLDPDAVAGTLERQDIDALLAVHLYGLPADMEPLLELAKAYDIPLIEDAAQAHGAEYQDQQVGSFGDVACFSFYPTKNMTTGEGGMIVTDDEDVADRAAQFVNHGRTDAYEHATVGHNFRMTSLAAAIGRIQLEKLDQFNRQRRENAALLTDLLTDTDLRLPSNPEGRKHVYHQYTIRHEQRDDLATHLETAEISSAIYYPTCIHRQPAYDRRDEEYPVAERTSQEVLSLPVHPNVSENDLQRIAEAIKRYDY
jgi:dTDP-4-amino-4,6-dideoxygalactose transaminase